MSAGNDFWAARAGSEFIASIKMMARSSAERNDLLKEQNDLLEANNRLLRQQIDATLEAIETLKYMRR